MRTYLEDELQKIELTIQTLLMRLSKLPTTRRTIPARAWSATQYQGGTHWETAHGSHGLQRQRLGGSIRNQHNVYLLEPVCRTIFGSVLGGLFGGGAGKRLRGNVDAANMMKIMPTST